MGCDIHMIAEKKSKYEYDSDEWKPLVTPIFKSRFYNEKDGISEWNHPYSFQPYEDRNYVVFAVLADQRNEYDIEPISEPRGYPNDMHLTSSWLLNGYDFVDHSPTWLTLEEVFAFPWDSKLTRTASVDLEEYKVFKENGKPKSWAAWTSGARVQYISNEDMDNLISGTLPTDPLISYHTQIEWGDTYSEICKDFLANMEVLKAYAEEENCEIRLIFGFDN